MSKYRLLENGFVEEIATKKIIPSDPANRDWQEYQQWLSEGNTPIGLPPDETYIFDGTTWVQSTELLILKIRRDYQEAQQLPVECDTTSGNHYTMDCREGDPIKLYNGIVLAKQLGETTMDIVDYYNQVHKNVPISEAEEIYKQQAAELRRRWMEKTNAIDALLKG